MTRNYAGNNVSENLIDEKSKKSGAELEIENQGVNVELVKPSSENWPGTRRCNLFLRKIS
jgi:hypothetical protein